jgi:hypothetical protein
MTTVVPTPPNAAYSLSEDLQEPGPSPSVMGGARDEVEFEDVLLQKLGARGWGRVCHFRQYYGPGWGQGAGKPLSPRAVEAFRRFLQNASFPDGRQPSVFLTDRGGIELCWEDADNKSVQVEFTSDGIEFYREATDQEGFFGFDRIPALVQTLARA